MGLLTELQCILMQAFGFALSFLLKPQAFMTDLIELLQGLKPVPLMLFAELTFQFNRFLIELLTALQCLLFQLLSFSTELSSVFFATQAIARLQLRPSLNPIDLQVCTLPCATRKPWA